MNRESRFQMTRTGALVIGVLTLTVMGMPAIVHSFAQADEPNKTHSHSDQSAKAEPELSVEERKENPRYGLSKLPDGVGYVVTETKSESRRGQVAPSLVPTIRGGAVPIKQLEGQWQVDKMFDGKERVVPAAETHHKLVILGPHVKVVEYDGDDSVDAGAVYVFAHPDRRGGLLCTQVRDNATYLGQYSITDKKLRLSISTVAEGNTPPKLEPSAGVRYYECRILPTNTRPNN